MPRSRGRSPLPPVSPPPGTLGRTYRQFSRTIPNDKHPRMAMVKVRVQGASNLKIQGLKGYRDELKGYLDEEDDNLWHFETKDPLLPGIPHIYRVEAKFSRSGHPTTTDVRVIRLIPGRIVYLEF